MNEFIVNTSDTYFLNNVYNDIDRLCTEYNDILSKKIIGKSVEGQNIIALVLKTSDKIKPSLLITGGIHAREDYSVMLVMKMIDYYCINYNCNSDIDEYNINEILNKVDIHFIPVANPDGLNIVHHGILSSSNYANLKDMIIYGKDTSCWKSNSRGVDINKNFDDGNWIIRSSTDFPSSERFKGSFANSEPETQALIQYCEHNYFNMMISYHCSGDCVFWADSGTHDKFDNYDNMIIEEFSNKYIYKRTKVSTDPSIYGCGFENWFRKRYHRIGLCIELSPYNENGVQNPDYMFNELVWQYAKNTGLFFAEKTIYLNDLLYDVYSNNILLKSFYDKSKAIDFAVNLFENEITIEHHNSIIFSSTKSHAAITKD